MSLVDASEADWLNWRTSLRKPGSRSRAATAAADRGLDLARGDPPAGGAGGDAAYDEIGADVVAIAPALPAGMARPHLPAVRIEEPTSERAWPLRRAPPAAALPVGGEAILHRLPERLVHDRRVLAGMDLARDAGCGR